MSSEGTLTNLAKNIETSKHKDLIYGGLFLFSQFLEGKPVETKHLIEPIQKSIKVLGEDIEKQMITSAEDSEEVLRINRFFGKCVKRKMFLAAGEDIEEEEKEQLKDDTKYLLEQFLKSLELL